MENSNSDGRALCAAVLFLKGRASPPDCHIFIYEKAFDKERAMAIMHLCLRLEEFIVKYAFILLSILLLSNCSSTSSIETLEYNGKTAYSIKTVAMGEGESPAGPEARERAAYELKHGTKSSRLAPQANKLCPNGYDIVKESELVEDPYLIAAAKKFKPRFKQTFLITCK